MSSSLHEIEEQARSLSAEDRAKLAEWRIEAFEKGDISAYSAEQVFAEARQILS